MPARNDRWASPDPSETGAIEPHAQAKLLERPKEGKNGMRQFGKVDIRRKRSLRR
jgi:hypothetical protein